MSDLPRLERLRVMDQPYLFSGFICLANGERQPALIRVDPPAETPDPLFECEIRSNLLLSDPYRVYSPLAHDAWAEAFEVLSNALRLEQAHLIDQEGRRVELPSPPRDRSWVTPARIPDVRGIEPIFSVKGWATRVGRKGEPVEMAIWPPFEEEPLAYCAPIRCNLLRDGESGCSYGASAEQAVYLAHRILQSEAEYLGVVDSVGRPIEIPLPPEPPLPE
jgi:hypothetical protein